MKRAPRSLQHHVLYRKYNGQDSEISALLGKCGFYNGIISGTENAIGRAPTFRRKLEVLVQGHLQAFADDPDLCRLFISEVRTLDDYIGSNIQELNRRYTHILVNLIAWGRENDFISSEMDSKLVRDFLFGGIEHLAWRQIANGRAIDVAQLTDQIVRLLMAGLKGGDAA